jgi:hypothetical protein
VGQILVQFLSNELEDAKEKLLYTRELEPGYRRALMEKMTEFDFLVNLPDNLYKLELASSQKAQQVGPPIEKQIYQAVVEGKA